MCHTDNGPIPVDRVCYANVSLRKLDLSFIDWEGTMRNTIELIEEKDEGEIDFGCGKDATCDIKYDAVCIVLWAKNRSVEILGLGGANFPFLIEPAKGNEQATIDRIAEAVKGNETATGDNSSSWKQLAVVFDFCFKNNLVRQTNRTIEVKTSVCGPAYKFAIHDKFAQAVDKLGWDAVTVTTSIEKFLCPGGISTAQQIGARLHTLALLGSAVPESAPRSSPSTTLEIIERVGLGLSKEAAWDGREKADTWVLLIAGPNRLHNVSDQKQSARSSVDLISRLGTICAHVEKNDLVTMENALRTSRSNGTPDQWQWVKGAVTSP